jgi:hypothetical protein
MLTHGELRIEPAPEILDATRQWLDPVRTALGHEFLAAYLTGSVLTQGFDPKRSLVNVLVVARSLGLETLDALHPAIPVSRRRPDFDPMFMTRTQLEKSLDVFPIEWIEIQERHLLIEGDDVFSALEVPHTHLRLQLEHELRGKHIQLRQAYLRSPRRPAELARVLKAAASSFATLFRTLLRLRGEVPPANTPQVIERVADLMKLDAQGLLVVYLVRYSGRRYKPEETIELYRKFLAEVDRLVIAIDQLRVP